MITYEKYVKPFSGKFHLIKIEQESIDKLNGFLNDLIELKKKESHHIIDFKSHFKRYYTGFLGEIALEQFLGIDGIVDWTIGNSDKYHTPDLKSIGLNIGVKTVNYGAFPIIFDQSYNPEIIMIKWKENYIYICGLATKKVLNEFQSKELILDKNLREKGTKTGFYGFSELVQFQNLDMLKELTLNN